MKRKLLFLWILIGLATTYGFTQDDESLFKESRDRMRYVKDDGVDKIVEDSKSAPGMKKEVDIIANTRDTTIKNIEKPIENESSKEPNKKMTGKIKTNTEDTKEISSVKNDTLKSDDGSHDDLIQERNIGVPVFITDDGKTIQLPQSDVLYNSKSGEILIRNRDHHNDTTVTEGTNNIFNVEKHDISDIKNIKGFVIDNDNANENNKVLYPVTIPSTPITTNESNIYQQSTIDDENFEPTVNFATIVENNTDVQNKSVDYTRTTNYQNTTVSTTNNENVDSHPTSDDAFSSFIVTEAFDAVTRSIKENAHEVQISLPLTSNSKFATGRSNERAFDVKTFKTDTAKELSEDESLYDVPFIGELNNNFKTEKEEKPASAEVLKPIQYDLGLFYEPDLSLNNEANPVEMRHSPVISNIESGKKSATVLSSDKPNGDTDQNNIAKAKMMDMDDLNGTHDDAKLINIEPKFSTTTEKLEPVDALRNYLEDIFLRGPIAILVDVEPKNLIRTREVWTSMESKAGNLHIEDVVLFGYDIDGITTMSYHKGRRQHGNDETETKSLTKTLHGITTTSKYYSGPGNPRMALSKAVQLLPYDSAIFIFEADRGDQSAGSSMGGGASAPVPGKLIKQLITKRIKIYCISSGQAWASGAAVTSGGSNIYLPVMKHPSSLHESLPERGNFQHHIIQETHPHGSHYREMRALSVYYDTDDYDELVYDEQQTLVLAHDVTGAEQITMHLDSGVKALTINITGQPKIAAFRTPHGAEINLLDTSSILNFSMGSKQLASLKDNNVRALLILTKKTGNEGLLDEEEEDMEGDESSEYHGKWKLHIQSDQPVDVQVIGDTNLRIMAKILKADSNTGGSNSVKIAVGGSVASIEEAEIVDVKGNPVGKLPINRGHEDSAESDTVEIESLRALESGTVVKQMKIPKQLKPGDKFRVRVEGRNDRDEHFVRISSILTIPENHAPKTTNESVELSNSSTVFVDQPGAETKANLELADGEVGYDNIDGGRAFNGSFNEQQIINNNEIGSTSLEIQPMTIIQLGMASRLHGGPGTIVQIHFEVTNRRENAVFYKFGARDDKYFLRSLTPQAQWISSGQTLNVVLTVGITSNAENNIRDTIIFTATGFEPTSLNLYVYVETNGRITSDRTRPVLRHEFIGDCMGYLGEDNCRQRFWGLDIIARDGDSGLMRIAAAPGLVYYHSNYIAGTRDESRARFTSSCCTHQIIVSATDVAGNMASYEVNVAQYFTPASIAAIVLGVILTIILIIVIILLIRLCIKRRKTSRDLPSYSTQRAT